MTQRVLIVGLNYSPEQTGIAPYTTAMAEALASEFDVRVLTTFPHYPEWRRREPRVPWTRTERRSDVHVARLRHYVPSDPTGLARVLSEASFAGRTVARRVGRHDAVVVVTPAFLPAISGRLLARRWGVPTGVVVQDLYSKAISELGLLGGRMDRHVHRLESRVLSSATSVVAVHERMRDTIVADYGVPAERIRTIPNWSHVQPPTAERARTRERLGWTGHRVVVHAGNMGAKQGLEHVLRAAREADARRLDLTFVLIGDGNRRDQLLREAQGIRSLEFRPSVAADEFTDVLAAADVLLLHERPGLDEMCAPSKLTSYFAAGRPVLAATAADSAAAREVRASGSGVVVPSGDVDALLGGVHHVLETPDSDSWGLRGQQYAREHLSERAARTAYRDWVRELMRASRGTDRRQSSSWT